MRVLALDGGSVKGAAQAQILSQAREPRAFDAVAGTSIGAVIAAYVAGTQDMTGVLRFFRVHAPRIFAGHCWRRYKLLTPRYPDKALNAALKATLPGRFGDLKIPTFITAADLNRRRLKVFSSVDPEDARWPTWEVARCAVAAETYFLPWNGFADAGIIVNNPSMVAITAACRCLQARVNELELFSIGTGSTVFNHSVGTTRWWPRLRWGLWILRTLLGGFSLTMHEAFTASLPLKKYQRIQFDADRSWEMDDPKVVDKCLTAWQADIGEAVTSLNKF